MNKLKSGLKIGQRVMVLAEVIGEQSFTGAPQVRLLRAVPVRHKEDALAFVSTASVYPICAAQLPPTDRQQACIAQTAENAKQGNLLCTDAEQPTTRK